MLRWPLLGSSANVFTFATLLARVLAMALYVSVCLSVCDKSEVSRNSWNELSWFWRGSFLPPILHRVKKEIQVSPKT